MNLLIKSTLNTLQKAKSLLTLLTNEQLRDESISPYHSSVGSHLRHIFDFYDCILNAEQNKVDLTARKRNIDVEKDCNSAKCYLDEIIVKLNELKDFVEVELLVTDDLGLGKMEIKYSFSALLAQANSHTIHHYAIINYILNGLNIKIEDDSFGFNPTTPKK
ncbi:MAG: DinB family protein, partial [Arcobacter sp.]|nr:DinB family protein [Arcobacter sp.]